MSPAALVRLPRLAAREATVVPRKGLTFVRLSLPAVRRGRLVEAVRLQLTQYMPAGAFGFVCRYQPGGNVVSWAWKIDAAAPSPRRAFCWPEPTLDLTYHGIRLLQRDFGFEGQLWRDGDLQQSRWFPDLPGEAHWRLFVRGCGSDPALHPLPSPTVALRSERPETGWLKGDNLPAVAPWIGWHGQLSWLLVGCVAAAALGAYLQARHQLNFEMQRLEALRSGREATSKNRDRFRQLAAELQSLQALMPKLSQLEMLNRIVASGIFASTPGPESVAVGVTPPGKPASEPLGSAQDERSAVRLLDWNYRNDQISLTLELPERKVTLLDVARRLEAVPGIGALRIGQDSSDNSITLIGRIAESGTTSAGRQ